MSILGADIRARRRARPVPSAGPRSLGRRPDSPYLPDLPYTPSLDGIRALAVAAVVFYHAGVAWLPGGFMGVDVFFVLSGYLITSLLLAEYRRSGAINLKRFWLGRARRLLPAAALVIFVCVVVGTLFLHDDLHSLRSDALASLLYVNNWRQILSGHSYFAQFSRPSLLQHYWSLSVEEQFYLFWPVLLMGGLALYDRRWLVWGAIGAAVASIVAMALLYHGGDPSRVYYGTDTRAAPLMIGALTAFVWPLGVIDAGSGGRAAKVLDGLGLAALVALVLLMRAWHYYDPFLYRGGFAIVALLVAVVIVAAVRPTSRFGAVLGPAPLRWLGQRSYGIYLWHWPVMDLTRPGIDLTWSSWVLVPTQIAITLVLATLSYRYVEMPIRRGIAWRKLRAWLDERRPRQRLAALAASSSVIAAVIMALVLWPAVAPTSSLQSLASASSPSLAGAGSVRSDQSLALSSGVAATPIAGGVLAVGSSVMLDSQPALQQALHARVQAAAGLTNAQIVDRLAADRAAGRLPANVVVSLGEAGPVPRATLRSLKHLLRGVSSVVLVNLRDPGAAWETEVNQALSHATHGWPGAIVADWHAASAKRSLLSDGVHPDAAGEAVYATVIARALRVVAALRAISAVQVTMVSDSVGATILETPVAQSELTSGLRVRLELRVCRRLVAPSCPYMGQTPPPALATIKSLGHALGSILIVDVGYNDDSAGYGAGIDQVMRAALSQGVDKVIWLTLRQFGDYAPVYQQTDAEIRAAARRWPQLEVADWSSYSMGKPWFADDVHPNATGAVALARFLRSYIVPAAAAAVSGSSR